jgi:hypothetical protein
VSSFIFVIVALEERDKPCVVCTAVPARVPVASTVPEGSPLPLSVWISATRLSVGLPALIA